MPRQAPDRALRRAATNLARLHPEDLAMILDSLSPHERARIDALIAGLGDKPEPPAETAAPPPPAWTYEGVSPWLRTRLDPEAHTGRAGREFFLMTDAGRDALGAAALPFRTSVTPMGSGRSLLGRIWARLAGRPG